MRKGHGRAGMVVMTPRRRARGRGGTPRLVFLELILHRMGRGRRAGARDGEGAGENISRGGGGTLEARKCSVHLHDQRRKIYRCSEHFHASRAGHYPQAALLTKGTWQEIGQGSLEIGAEHIRNTDVQRKMSFDGRYR